MKIKKNGYLKLALFIGVVLFLGACKTNKNTSVYRGWHNTTARFNGYYYSEDNMSETIKKIEEAQKDDFSKLLPIFINTDNTTSKSYYSDCDKTIKKSSIVIQRHAITEKNSKVEIPNACKWIDENYMLIGKAHFYKRDLFSAQEAFEYVSKVYPNPEAKYNGMIWLIRTNNEIGSFIQSESCFDQIRNAKDLPKNKTFQRDLALVSADYNIKRNDYNEAIKHLIRAIAYPAKKATKARYIYVLAQLYEKIGDNGKAANYYAMVPGLNPEYTMVFNAQMNHAKLFDITADNSKLVKKKLFQMLKDDKNKEFKDQIYYALAEIALKENDTPVALDYLAKSIKESTENKTQKALSYLKRADIYFEKMDYKNASTNYDSTMAILPKDYVNYNAIQDKKTNLTELMTNLNVIILEDSLQRLAKMSEKERNAQLDKIIAAEEVEAKRREEERLNQLKNPIPLPEPIDSKIDPVAGLNSWYFYNPKSMAFGKKEFSKKWGSRKLEDNWRRIDKAQSDMNFVSNENNNIDTTQGLVEVGDVSFGNNKKKDIYLKKIPLTPDSLEKSNHRIADAYYSAGSIYKEQLQNNQKSIETFEELLKRYPENDYKLTTYYQLYRTYLAMNNQVKSDYYKNLLLTQYPDSDYAAIIKNPASAIEIAASKSEVEKFYNETYQLYTAANYTQVYDNCKRAETKYSKSHLLPQFSFLKALAVGRTQDISAFENELKQVVARYPKSSVKEKAQATLDVIQKQKKPLGNPAPDTLSAVEKPKFVFNEGGEYYCIIVIDNGKGNLDKFKSKLSNFNATSFGLAGIGISNVMLDPTHQLVSVKTFLGKDQALNYMQTMQTPSDLFNDLENGSFEVFIISAENYFVFYKEKNIVEYKKFFANFY